MKYVIEINNKILSFINNSLYSVEYMLSENLNDLVEKIKDGTSYDTNEELLETLTDEELETELNRRKEERLERISSRKWDISQQLSRLNSEYEKLENEEQELEKVAEDD